VDENPDMIDLFPEAIEYLRTIMGNDPLNPKIEWRSSFIDYHKPYVERLWIPWREYRLSIHRVYPCKTEEALYHNHPWPQAIKIISSWGYEMGIGYGEDKPPITCKLVFNNATKYTHHTYEMLTPNSWHYVRPVIVSSISLMITGKPWKQESKPKYNFRELSKQEKDTLLKETWNNLFGV